METLQQKKWQEKKDKTPEAIIIDVRTTEEYEAEHLENALNIDISNPPAFMESISQLDKNKPYFLYCRSGNRSWQAAQIMKMEGIEKTYNLENGIENWEGKTIQK